MKWFRNLKIKSKLGLSFAACILIASVAILIAIDRMNEMQAKTDMLNTQSVMNSQNLSVLIDDVRQYRALEMRSLVAQSDKDIQDDLKQAADMGDKIEVDFDAYKKVAVLPEDKKNIDEARDAWKGYRSFDDELSKAALSRNAALGDEIINKKGKAAWNVCKGVIHKMMDWNAKRAKSLAGASKTASKQGIEIMCILLGATILLGITMATLVTRSITDPIGKIIDTVTQLAQVGIPNVNKSVKAIADGDLTVDIPASVKNIEVVSTDETGILCSHVNDMLETIREMAGYMRTARMNLSEMLGQSKVTSDTIATSASELASGNQDLASRTSEQAASLEETASSLEEITSLIEQSAERAKEASSLSGEAKQLAENGGSVVKSAVEAMRGIEESSKKIEAIIGVIDEIAFQTNLLSLNAAVEAARVGEQGKGFAVVASEVRSLAGRSATAAKEIKGLVLDSVQRVEHGTKLVNSSGEELKHIVASVDRVVNMVAEISSAAQEQSAGIEQINKAVSQMDEITQKNAALVEESSAASESMAQQADDLRNSVSRFKIDESNLHLSTPTVSSYVSRSASSGKKEPRSSKPARKVVGGSSDYSSHVSADRSELTFTKDDDEIF